MLPKTISHAEFQKIKKLGRSLERDKQERLGENVPKDLLF